MKKMYICPQSRCITLQTKEIMENTSQIEMGGRADSFDAKRRLDSEYEDYEDDTQDAEDLW